MEVQVNKSDRFRLTLNLTQQMEAMGSDFFEQMHDGVRYNANVIQRYCNLLQNENPDVRILTLPEASCCQSRDNNEINLDDFNGKFIFILNRT